MKRALIVANLGGFASFLLSDIDILQKMGYQITYAANGNVLAWEDTKAELQRRNVRIRNISFESKSPFSSENLKAYFQIKELLQEQRFDVIHCHTPIAGLVVRCAARKSRKDGCKVVYTTHGFAFNKHSSKKSWLVFGTIERLMSKLCDAIITINKEDYENAEKMHCKQVFYIHGVGVCTEKFRNTVVNKNEYRRSLGIEPDDTMVLSIGELSERKNHRVVIEAIAKLDNKDKYVYAICGNGVKGGTGQLLQKLAEELDVRVKLLGFRRDIPEIVHCSDIGVIPSVREGLGLAGLESMAAGIPVLGSDVQGIRDYVVDGDTGYLCDAYTSGTFTQAFVRFENTSLAERKRMEKCCKRMAEQFSMSVSEKEREAIYRQQLSVDA